jgi:hypothetical protein
LEPHFFDGEVPEVVAPAQVEWVTDFEGDAAEIPVEEFAGGYGADGGADAEGAGDC